MTRALPTNPHSSPTVQKMKSVLCSGTKLNFVCVPCKKPFPQKDASRPQQRHDRRPQKPPQAAGPCAWACRRLHARLFHSERNTAPKPPTRGAWARLLRANGAGRRHCRPEGAGWRHCRPTPRRGRPAFCPARGKFSDRG